MSPDDHPRRRFFELGIEKSKWTPRAVAVLATAKDMAFPGHQIKANDLLLALASGNHEISRLLKRLAISPSAAPWRVTPGPRWPVKELCREDFDVSLDDLQRLVLGEADALRDSRLGIEHLLLALARIGVPGVDLPYERIKKTWLEMMGRKTLE